MTIDLEAKRLAVLQSLKRSANKQPTGTSNDPSTTTDGPLSSNPASLADSNTTNASALSALPLKPQPPPPPPTTQVESIPPPPKSPRRRALKKVDVGRVYKNALPKKSIIEQAILDLTRLGYSYKDILDKTNINPNVLLKAFQQYGFPVVKPSTTPAVVSAPEPVPNFSPSPQAVPAPSLAQHHFSKVSLPERSASNPSFGSDRWSKSLQITLSDDEHDDSSESDSEGEDKHRLQTPQSAPAGVLSARSTPPTNSHHPSNKNNIAQSLDAQREKIRQVTAQLKLLQEQKVAQKVAQKAATEPASPAAHTPPLTDKPTSSVNSADKTELLRQRLLALKNRKENNNEVLQSASAPDPISLPFTTTEPEHKVRAGSNDTNSTTKTDVEIGPLAVTKFEPPAPSVSTHNVGHHNPRVSDLVQSLDRAREEQEKLAHMRSSLQAQVEALDTNKTKQHIEDLKRELEKKMNDLVEQTYQYATVKATYEATKAQEERLQHGISSLEHQLSIEEAATSYDSNTLMLPYSNQESDSGAAEKAETEDKSEPLQDMVESEQPTTQVEPNTNSDKTEAKEATHQEPTESEQEETKPTTELQDTAMDGDEVDSDIEIIDVKAPTKNERAPKSVPRPTSSTTSHEDNDSSSKKRKEPHSKFDNEIEEQSATSEVQIDTESPQQPAEPTQPAPAFKVRCYKNLPPFEFF